MRIEYFKSLNSMHAFIYFTYEFPYSIFDDLSQFINKNSSKCFEGSFPLPVLHFIHLKDDSVEGDGVLPVALDSEAEAPLHVLHQPQLRVLP